MLVESVTMIFFFFSEPKSDSLSSGFDQIKTFVITAVFSLSISLSLPSPFSERQSDDVKRFI